MKSYSEFLAERLEAGGFSTEDTLASLLPLMHEVQQAHEAGMVAPLDGIDLLHVEGVKLWFSDADRQDVRTNVAAIRGMEQSTRAAVEVVAQWQRTSEVAGDAEIVADLSIATGDAPVERPAYVTGYRCWEHLLGHHDPLTDIFSLGMLLASLACGLDFSRARDLQAFVGQRNNLFSLAARIHPVLAQAITRMTELDRHRRAQDLRALIRTLENYRDQDVDVDFDLAQVAGYEQKDARSKRAVVLTKLRERLFELSKRNRLLHFRSSMSSVNLTHASVPLSFDLQNIRPEQILVWNASLQQRLMSGKRFSLNQYLNFAEALYLPGLLDRIGAETRKDQTEFGFAQLRLVVCFLHWANLKEKPAEQYDSPLVLLPVKLIKKKGIRDTYFLEVLSREAELNPVVRHQFKQLYNIDLPETLDLEATDLDAFFDEFLAKVQASEPAISVDKIGRPRIAVIHDRARRKLDHYYRRARLAGRGVRTFQDLEYSYDPANYHPLGIKLFAEKVRPPSTRLRAIIEEKPRPRTFVTAEPSSDVVERERTFFALQEAGEENPYAWSFDLCSVTLANFRYRKMSLVRDYEALLASETSNEAFDAVFSLTPRESTRSLPESAPLEDRHDVVPCDPTQSTAIDEARSQRSYIIQGPPGTGKSQTITNLIADYVARGKRVLFVCEKRAAIDVVYARLRHCGLGDLSSLIHDSQTDKKAFVMDLKRTYEAFLEEKKRKRNKRKDPSRDDVLQRLLNELGPLERFDQAMQGVPVNVGVSARALLDRCIELKERLPGMTPLERERLPDFATWSAHAERIERLESRLRQTIPDGVLARHPFRLLNPSVLRTERPLESVLQAVSEATAHLSRLRERLSTCGIPTKQGETLAQVADLAAYARLIRPLTRTQHLKLLDSKSSQAKALAKQQRNLDRLRRGVEEAREATANWRTKLPATDVPAALELAERLETSYFPWLRPAWWRLRGILNRAYDFTDHVVRPSWSQILRRLRNEYEQVAKLEDAKRAVADELGTDLDLDELSDAMSTIRQTLPSLPPWIRQVHADILKSNEPEVTTTRLDEAEDHAQQLLASLEGVVDEVQDNPLDELQGGLESIEQQQDELPDLLPCLAELADLPSAVSTALRALPYTVAELEAACADHAWQRTLADDSWLQEFDSQKRSGHAVEIDAAYGDWLRANAGDVYQRTRDRFRERVRISELPAAQLSPDEKEFKKRYNRGRRELEHEFGKTMRYKAIRDLVSGESGDVVGDLKPVWLMSPLSVSDTLPLDSDAFDVVLFDEASQITLEEAVPSLFRAAQAIVVGDEMQLPPTDFFSAKRPGNDEDEVTFEEDGEAVQYDLDSNSFLNHAAKNLWSTMLGWHYRSRSESLISFSNWAFYDGRLLTVPEEQLPESGLEPIRASQPFDGDRAAADLLRRAVSFHELTDGVYQNRRNQTEAEYIARVVSGILKLGQGMTIGVVAFSEAQQDEIESALGRLAQEDRRFRDLYEAELEREEDGQFVGLLVKNLENIQGDERDAIILSVCYGPNAAGKMYMNFGPINKSGGEKRLNVAFSRAKHHMAVVSSIHGDAITNDYNDGARCLKNYLRYAQASSLGDIAGAQRVLHSMARWQAAQREADETSREVVTEQLAAALRGRGLEVACGVGQSHFRCDVAIRRAEDAAWRLGILIDTAQYYEQADLLERDVLRPKLLENFGWRIHVVLAKDWYADSDRVLARVVQTASAAGVDRAESKP